ncbi:hypothetical protein D3C77_431880 [compost metagenome]
MRFLPQLAFIANEVKNVILDLKSKPDRAAERFQRRQLLRRSRGNPSASFQTEDDQIARFMLMNVLQLLEASQPLLSPHIGHLPSHHAGRAGKTRQLFDYSQSRLCRNTMNFTRLHDMVKSMRQQCIAGQNRHRFSEHFVIRRFAPPEIVVIHRRQIIMDQGIRMYHFHSAGDRQGSLPAPSQRFRCSDDEQRTQSLTAGHQ